LEETIMADINSLSNQIDAEFSAVADRIKQFQAEQVKGHQERQKRLEQLSQTFEELRNIWKPRLELLVKKFGDRVKVTPRVVPSTREALFEFQSQLARVRLKFSAYTDRDIQKLILSYDLEIIPVLMRFTPHAEAEFPLSKIDKEAVARWFDERIVDFVRTYLSLGDTEVYLKEHMVEDPIAHVRFPSMIAGATLDWKGQKFYFLNEETRREFAEKNKITIP
jgi:hypothetical protein